MVTNKAISWAILTICGFACTFVNAQAKDPNGEEIVKFCFFKNFGQDQKTKMVYTMKNAEGTVTKKRTYRRFWKDYRGEGDLVSKMMLFTIKPLEYRGYNGLMIDYTLRSGKPPDRWVFSRKTRTVRRVANREKSNLDSGFVAEDLDVRQLDDDTHTLIDTFEEDGSTVYKVESVPKVGNSIYGKMISQFVKRSSWDDCTLRSTDYYDKSGELIKKAAFTWQQIDGAWLVDRANIVIQEKEVRKEQDSQEPPKNVYITYEITEPEVNVGLTDKDFSQRALQKSVQ